MNFNNPETLRNLRDHMAASKRKLRPFYRHRKSAVEQYVGYRYTDNGTSRPVPMNYMEMAVNIYTRLLTPSEPKVTTLTPHAHLKPSAIDLELAVNHTLSQLDFSLTLQRCVMEALFLMGVVKVGMTRRHGSRMKGFLFDTGQPYVEVVSPEDFIVDMSARRWEHIMYVGNKYTRSLESVQQDPAFDEEMRNQLRPSQPQSIQQAGREDADQIPRQDRASEISQGNDGFADQSVLENEVELWDLWIPRDKLFITIAANQELPRPLRIIPWTGPDRGPYHMLRFGTVPDNIVPLPPVSQWYDLHVLLNNVVRKLSEQAKRQKTLLLVQNGNEADGEKITSASDGEAIPVEDASAHGEVSYGGPSNVLLAFAQQTRMWLSLAQGNIESLGGLAPGADTVGQEKLMSQSAGQRVSDMQDAVSRFIEEICEDLAWYLWDDPFIQLPLTKRIPNSDIEIPFEYRQESKSGDFLDYNFRFEPYAAQHRSPAERLNMINQIAMNYLMSPMGMQLMQAQGLGFDMAGFLKLLGKYGDIPELSELVIPSQAVAPYPPVTTAGGKNTSTSREYVRRSQGNSQANQQQQINELMGMGGTGAPDSAMN